MRFRAAQITLATALAAAFSSAAQAGMNNINVSPGLANLRVPDVKARPLAVDANIRLHCSRIPERNETGAWVARTRCN
ncbi:MAG: hypothetical protein U1E61_15665 [Bradyrhizobium sp.]